MVFSISPEVEIDTRISEAEAIVSDAYRRRYAPHIELQTVHNELCKVDYKKIGFTKTLTVEGHLSSGAPNIVLGTLRVLSPMFSDQPAVSISPLELMNYIEPEEGWIAFEKRGFNPYASLEIGRVAIAREITEREAKAIIMRYLFAAAFDIVRNIGANQVWAVTIEGIRRAFARGGLDMLPVDGSVRVHPRTAEAAAIIDRYQRYWKDGEPSLYQCHFPNFRYWLHKQSRKYW